MNITLENNSIVLRDTLFWDIPKEKVDAVRNAPLIIERVLNRGNQKEFFGLIAFYGESFFIENAKRIKTLDKKTVNFLSTLFNIKRESFICYSIKQ